MKFDSREHNLHTEWRLGFGFCSMSLVLVVIWKSHF